MLLLVKNQKLLQSVTQDREALEEKLRVTEQLKWEIEVCVY